MLQILSHLIMVVHTLLPKVTSNCII